MVRLALHELEQAHALLLESVQQGHLESEVGMQIVAVSEAEVSDELVEALQRLIPQLSASSAPPGRESLLELVRSPATTLFIARDPEQQGAIAGTLTLAMFRIPTGLRAWIEDVVVDSAARGRGVGEALCRAAIEHARQAGAQTIDLTTRPAREAANRLYRRLGFVQRETNVYRYTLE